MVSSLVRPYSTPKRFGLRRERYITLKMFIRMMTLIGTPMSHKRTLRIFLNSVSFLADKLAAHTRVPPLASGRHVKACP